MFNTQQQEIYERYKNPENSGHVNNPDFLVNGTNPFCGDDVHLEGKINAKGELIELLHICSACAICTAAADQLPELFLGKKLTEIRSLPLTDVTQKLGIPLSPTRLKCALLPFETLKQAEIK